MSEIIKVRALEAAVAVAEEDSNAAGYGDCEVGMTVTVDVADCADTGPVNGSGYGLDEWAISPVAFTRIHAEADREIDQQVGSAVAGVVADVKELLRKNGSEGCGRGEGAVGIALAHHQVIHSIGGVVV